MDRPQPSLATPHKPERVPESLDKRLLAYTLAASAGLAAAPELAQATIVYTNPNDINIFNDGQFIDIDLNNDGTADARVTINKSYPIDAAYVSVLVGGNGQPTEVIGSVSFADALLTGNPISSLQTFQDIQNSTRLMASAYAYYDQGPYAPLGGFANAGDRFLGFMFEINGIDHFGWARFDVFVSAVANSEDTFAEARVTLRDYAFENCAGVGINAGDQGPGASCPSGVPMPPALALVALGAGGLALWRARRRDGQ